MKTRLALTTTLALALTLASAALSASGRGEQPKPFHARFTFATSLPASPAPCAETRIDVGGSGNATHLGRFQTVQFHCLTAADPLAFTDGRYRFTGAHGDSISGTYAGRFVPLATPGSFGVDGRFTIDGGTGRFAGATGGGSAGGEATLAGGTVVLDGSICLRHHDARRSHGCDERR